MPREFLPWDPGFVERSALFEPLRPLARKFSREPHFPSIARWNEVLDLPVRFQEQTPPPRGRRRLEVPRQHYSTQIHEEKRVPSRAASWHDFFNALVWAMFVRSKSALYARQSAAVTSWASGDARRLPNRRTRELDALAIFDEGGVIVLSDEQGSPERMLVFGHAIYESVMLRDTPPDCRVSTVPLRVGRLPDDLPSLLDIADRGVEALLRDPEQFRQPKREPGLLLRLRP